MRSLGTPQQFLSFSLGAGLKRLCFTSRRLEKMGIHFPRRTAHENGDGEFLHVRWLVVGGWWLVVGGWWLVGGWTGDGDGDGAGRPNVVLRALANGEDPRWELCTLYMEHPLARSWKRSRCPGDFCCSLTACANCLVRLHSGLCFYLLIPYACLS